MQTSFQFQSRQETTTKWSPPNLATLPSWRGVKRLGLDIETYDPDLKEMGPGVRRGAFITGISFGIEDGEAHYLPIAHASGNVDKEMVLAYLRDNAKDFDGDVVGANIGYDLDFLSHENVLFGKARFRDIQIADPLINELHQSYSLENCARRWGFPGKNESGMDAVAAELGLVAKAEMHRMPAFAVAPYAIEDVRLPLVILRRQERELDAQDLFGIYNLESALLPVLVKMRSRGVKVDQDKLAEIELWALSEERTALATVRHLTGVDIGVGNVWKPDILAKALKAVGISVGLTDAGNPSVKHDFLDALDHPVGEPLAWARKVNKLRTTFVTSIRKHMTNGRIHCVFNQLARDDGEGTGIKGARWGRMSSEKPNLQQQPARDDFAARWRSIYVPDGEIWACCDYSQQEPRLTTHYAVKAGCAEAWRAAERYCNNPLTDNHQMMADLTGLPRKQAKNLYLGLCYGMGGAKLAGSLGLPTEWRTFRNDPEKRYLAAGPEAQAIIDKFNETAPFISQLAKKCKEIVEQRGYIKTLLGRRCRFIQKPDGTYDFTHKSLNRLIQGSAADQMKKAMVDADAAGFPLQLQVHDELDLSVNSICEAGQLGVLMRDTVKLLVPSRVDVEIGPSWGKAKVAVMIPNI